MKLLAPTLLAAALLGGCSMMPSHSSMMASDMPTRAADGRLIGPTGNTLYVFSKDSPGMSNFTDATQTGTGWQTAASNGPTAASRCTTSSKTRNLAIWWATAWVEAGKSSVPELPDFSDLQAHSPSARPWHRRIARRA